MLWTITTILLLAALVIVWRIPATSRHEPHSLDLAEVGELCNALRDPELVIRVLPHTSSADRNALRYTAELGTSRIHVHYGLSSLGDYAVEVVDIELRDGRGLMIQYLEGDVFALKPSGSITLQMPDLLPHERNAAREFLLTVRALVEHEHPDLDRSM